MPRDMFGDIVEPSIKVGSKKWYTVPLSIIVHTVIIGNQNSSHGLTVNRVSGAVSIVACQIALPPERKV